MAGQEIDPLILTLQLDEESFRHFDQMRQRHFPRGLNRVPAHLTFFHHLPGEERAAIEAELVQACQQLEPMELMVSDVMMLGRGVAYRVESAALQDLQKRLAERWDGWLIPQDRQRFRPHVVVQNKANPEQARELYRQLQGEFRPYPIRGEGLCLWWYRGGPWELAGQYPFAR